MMDKGFKIYLDKGTFDTFIQTNGIEMNIVPNPILNIKLNQYVYQNIVEKNNIAKKIALDNKNVSDIIKEISNNLNQATYKISSISSTIKRSSNLHPIPYIEPISDPISVDPSSNPIISVEPMTDPISPLKKDGDPYPNITKCIHCNGTGCQKCQGTGYKR